MQAARLPVRPHAHRPTSGPAGSRTLNLDFKRVLLCRLSYKADQCVGQELNLHSACGWVTATWARRCPADTFVAVPWMGFEPMISASRAWRPLRAGPPGHPSVAQGGVEPPASLLLEEGGLPVAYRASGPPRCQRAVGQSARRELNPPVRFGRPVPGPLGHGHVSLSERRGSRTLKARRTSGFRPGAVASRLALPFAVWMAGFEPAWSGVRGRRMKPGSPTSRGPQWDPRGSNPHLTG